MADSPPADLNRTDLDDITDHALVCARAGIKHAQGLVLVTMDADLQNDPVRCPIPSRTSEPINPSETPRAPPPLTDGHLADIPKMLEHMLVKDLDL
eukprot:585556-Prorocentrum_minimum.AAC.1